MSRFSVLLRRGPLLCSLVAAILCASSLRGEEAAHPPQVGEDAPKLALADQQDKPVELGALTKTGPVVVLFLRGFPEYQCPLCTRQVADFVGVAGDFAKEETSILMVYPGPARDLKKHAADFQAAREFPRNVLFVTDPDFHATEGWHLRWNAPRETAYPSTFVIDQAGKVRFAKVSKSHGERTKAADILKVVQELKPTAP